MAIYRFISIAAEHAAWTDLQHEKNVRAIEFKKVALLEAGKKIERFIMYLTSYSISLLLEQKLVSREAQ